MANTILLLSSTKKSLLEVTSEPSITNIAYKRIMNPLTAIDWVFKLTKDHKIFEDSLKVVSETTQKVISERRKYYAEHPDELQESTNELGVRKRMPLIDTLLKAHVDGQPLSNRDIEDEVNTFLFAGHDTTSHTLGYFFYNVAKHPEVQEKIFEEVSNVFGGIPENNELTTRKINELKYLEAVIKESMRLYATV
uniref:Cytochrome P450 n=1 Tax=Megaselia scalaris TaxID=36166 RepID=T1GZH6_MEGSC